MSKRRTDDEPIVPGGEDEIAEEEVVIETASEETVEAVAEEEEAPNYVPWDSFEAKIVKPEEDTPKETRQPIPDGHRLLAYEGPADVMEYGEYVLRPGQPVIVPSDVAEELLTMPFETFRIEE
jgi:hypothetical protein